MHSLPLTSSPVEQFSLLSPSKKGTKVVCYLLYNQLDRATILAGALFEGAEAFSIASGGSTFLAKRRNHLHMAGLRSGRKTKESKKRDDHRCFHASALKGHVRHSAYYSFDDRPVGLSLLTNSLRDLSRDSGTPHSAIDLAGFP